MLRLATTFATATLLALHGAPLADATACTAPPATFLGTPAFFPSTATDIKPINPSSIVHVEVQGRQINTGDAPGRKSLLLAHDGTGSVGSAITSTLENAAVTAGDLTNSFDFTVVYTPTATGAGITLSVQYDNWAQPQLLSQSDTNAILAGNTAQVVGLQFSGATNGNGPRSNSATIDITQLKVNNLPYTPPTALTSPDNQKLTHYIYVDCTTGATTITGKVTFTWRSPTNSLGNRPYFKLALGDPKACPKNQEVIVASTGNTADCGCPPPLIKTSCGYCVCPDTLQAPTLSGTCQAPPPAIRTCLTMPAFDDTSIDNSMTSQKDVQDNNDLPVKAQFTTAGYGATGLVIGAKAFTDGLQTAEFRWIGSAAHPALYPACSALFTQNFANIASSTWTPNPFLKLSGVATPQQGETPYEQWSDLPKLDFTLTLGSQDLNECGFSTVTEDDHEHFVTYENTLCGDFKYKECYSDAWGFVDVPTEVKTCYVVKVKIPKSLDAEASVHMVDREKVDMRFSSKTDCAYGPNAEGLWRTDLEFKTIVQYPYKIDSVTVTPVTTSGAPVVIAAGDNINCATYTEFDLTTDGAVFDNLDLGDLKGNSYCRQDWFRSNFFEAYVQAATGNCDESDVDEFTVTVTGACQSSIAGEHITCPTTANTFSYTTTVSVPRVCVKTIAFDKTDFPATLVLYKSLDPLATAVVYTPRSTLCGALTITPSAATPLDVDILNDFILTKIEIFYTSQTSALDQVTMQTPFTAPLVTINPITITGTAPALSWVGTFCLIVDDEHVPGLQHTVLANHDYPDVTSAVGNTNGISIFQRGYTVRATAELRPNGHRRLRTRVDRITADATKPGQAEAEAKFETLQMISAPTPTAPTTTESAAAPKTTTSGEGVKAVSPEAPAVETKSKQAAQAPGNKVGVAVGVGIGVLAAVVLGVIVVRRRRA